MANLPARNASSIYRMLQFQSVLDTFHHQNCIAEFSQSVEFGTMEDASVLLSLLACGFIVDLRYCTIHDRKFSTYLWIVAKCMKNIGKIWVEHGSPAHNIMQHYGYEGTPQNPIPWSIDEDLKGRVYWDLESVISPMISRL